MTASENKQQTKRGKNGPKWLPVRTTRGKEQENVLEWRRLEDSLTIHVQLSEAGLEMDCRLSEFPDPWHWIKDCFE